MPGGIGLGSRSASFAANAELANINRFVKIVADAKVAYGAANTDVPIGILQSKATAAGQAVEVIESGEAEIVLGGNANAGDYLASGANGVGIAASANMIVGAQAMRGGVANDVVPVIVIRGFKA